MAVPLKLDITTGDKITPSEIQYDYKLMLEDRHIQVMAYNLATILAEKLETVCNLVRRTEKGRLRRRGWGLRWEKAQKGGKGTNLRGFFED